MAELHEASDMVVDPETEKVFYVRKSPLRRAWDWLTAYSVVAEGGKTLVHQNEPAPAGSRTTTVVNKYLSYSEKTRELNEKFLGCSKQGGISVAQSVIAFLVGQIAGTGVEYSQVNQTEDNVKSSEKETFAQAYVRWNKLNGRGLYNAIQTSCIEGRALRHLTLVQSDDPRDKVWNGKKVIAETIRYCKEEYKVSKDRKTIVFEGPDDSKRADLTKDFVYVQTDGFDDDPNDTPSPASKLLQEMETITEASQDLRKYNAKFPNLTTIFEVADLEAAKWLHGKLFRQLGVDGFGKPRFVSARRIGDSVIIPGGTAKVLEAAGNAVQSILEELFMQFRMVSGGVGMPVIYLGPVDLPSNRATAQEQPEMINSVTQNPRKVWEDAMVEELQLAGKLFTADGKQAVDTDVTAKIPFVNMSWLALLADILKKVGLENVISWRSMSELLPFVDAKKEQDRLAKQQADQAKKAIDAQKAMASGTTPPPPGGKGAPPTKQDAQASQDYQAQEG